MVIQKPKIARGGFPAKEKTLQDKSYGRVMRNKSDHTTSEDCLPGLRLDHRGLEPRTDRL